MRYVWDLGAKGYIGYKGYIGIYYEKYTLLTIMSACINYTNVVILVDGLWDGTYLQALNKKYYKDDNVCSTYYLISVNITGK